jgi:hypothetical protein
VRSFELTVPLIAVITPGWATKCFLGFIEGTGYIIYICDREEMVVRAEVCGVENGKKST